MPKNREIMSSEVTALSNHCRTIRSYIMRDPMPDITLLISAIMFSVAVTKAEQGVKMKITVSTSHNNRTIETWYLDLNRHLTVLNT